MEEGALFRLATRREDLLAGGDKVVVVRPELLEREIAAVETTIRAETIEHVIEHDPHVVDIAPGGEEIQPRALDSDIAHGHQVLEPLLPGVDGRLIVGSQHPAMDQAEIRLRMVL